MLTLFFGYVTLGFSEDPDYCYASDNSNFRVTDQHAKATDDFVNVGERFTIVFNVAFYASLIVLVMGLLNCMGSVSLQTMTLCCR